MITCIIGTRAQLIKMAPVMREMETRGLAYQLIFTGQHEVTMAELLEEFGIRTRPEVVYSGREVTGIVQMGGWFCLVLWRLFKIRKQLRVGPRAGNIALVHGDTFSTLLGALLGKICGIQVGHVESGLRSFNWFHPFPEELTRLAVFRMTDIAFCPNAWARDNLRSYSMEKIDCGQNTLLDCVRFALAHTAAPDPLAPPAGYGVVSLHRFENIFHRLRLLHILDLLDLLAASHRLIFVLHPATHKKLLAFGLFERLDRHSQFDLRPRMGYLAFLRLIRGARFVVTDGGSNQEELSYLGVPTLLMRKATERHEGLDQNVVIANYDPAVVAEFVASLSSSPAAVPALPDAQPSGIIVDRLQPFVSAGDALG
ncbi:MAG: UDP-N-acetylglucosamine 2-epimerase [Betaproteobacteria bacterium]|nr:UDP-N-acetylglucosamine 2-epimerase [Betaproteobacteria bacterium]